MWLAFRMQSSRIIAPLPSRWYRLLLPWLPYLGGTIVTQTSWPWMSFWTRFGCSGFFILKSSLHPERPVLRREERPLWYGWWSGLCCAFSGKMKCSAGLAQREWYGRWYGFWVQGSERALIVLLIPRWERGSEPVSSWRCARLLADGRERPWWATIDFLESAKLQRSDHSSGRLGLCSGHPYSQQGRVGGPLQARLFRLERWLAQENGRWLCCGEGDRSYLPDTAFECQWDSTSNSCVPRIGELSTKKERLPGMSPHCWAREPLGAG